MKKFLLHRNMPKRKILAVFVILAGLMAFSAMDAFAGEFTNESTRNSWYNRTNAKWYAETYAVNPNPNFYNYSAYGGDCTNFASQVVNYGGMSELGA